MSDARIAQIGRRLAVALSTHARERKPETSKAVLELHTELCRAVRDEAEGQEGLALDAPAPPPWRSLGDAAAVVVDKTRRGRAMIPLASSRETGTRPDGVEMPP